MKKSDEPEILAQSTPKRGFDGIFGEHIKCWICSSVEGFKLRSSVECHHAWTNICGICCCQQQRRSRFLVDQNNKRDRSKLVSRSCFNLRSVVDTSEKQHCHSVSVFLDDPHLDNLCFLLSNTVAFSSFFLPETICVVSQQDTSLFAHLPLCHQKNVCTCSKHAACHDAAD